jgi:ATP-dependent RNA helicase DHX37/DHR1
MLSAVGAYEYDPTPSFCHKHFLRLKAMQEIQQLRRQISTISNIPLSNLTPPTDTKASHLLSPSSFQSQLTIQLKILRQIIASGFIDQVAVRQDIYLKKTTTFTSTRNVPYRALGVPGEVYIHPSSALFHRSPPDFLVFSEIVQTSKAWMKGITKINGAWLPTLGKGLCTFSRPVDVPGKISARALEIQGGKQGEEREVLVVPHFGALGVDLPPVKKKQRREGARWVLLD